MCTGCGIGNGISNFSVAGFFTIGFRFHGFHDIVLDKDAVVETPDDDSIAGAPRRA